MRLLLIFPTNALKVLLLLWSAILGLGSSPPVRGTSQPVVSAINAWALQTLSPAQLDQQFAAISKSGVKMVRLDASWSTIEPQPPLPGRAAYRFTGFDNDVREMALRHLTWEPILDYSAPWAAIRPGDWRSPPANDKQFAAYARAVVARYGPAGSFWLANPQLPYEPITIYEIWNEENTRYFWDTGPNPTRYAALYLAARAAIKAVDPAAQVIVGGLTSGGASEFASAMFVANPALRGNVDGFGLHPYADSGVGVEEAVIAFRESLIRLGEGATPIDVTEFGWPLTLEMPDGLRAQMMREVALTLGRSNCGIRLLAPYDWMNPYPSGGRDYGIANPIGLRGSGIAWFDSLTRAAFMPRIALCPTG